jgi:CRP/FNR family transcriptional regulator
MKDLSSMLGRVWHFRHLAKTDLRMIVTAGHLRRYREGTIIFHEQESSAGMYVLFRGKVHLCKLSHTGQVQIISVIEPVIMFNEVTAIDGGPNPFTAIAAKDCLTWNISHEAFEDLVIRYPDPNIGLGMLRVLAARTRLLIDRCEDLSFRPVVARTAKFLLEASNHGAKVINRRDHPIKDMAAGIATVPEAISRSLKSLKEDQLIECTRTKITILNPTNLAKMAWMEPLFTPE